MKTKLPLIRAVQFGFGAVVAILFIVAVITYRGVIASTTSARWAQHTSEVLERLANLRSAMENVESGYRDFALSGDAAFVELSRASMGRLDQEQRVLRALTVDNLRQQRRLGMIAHLVEGLVQRGDTMIRLRQSGASETASDVIRDPKGDLILEQLRAVTREMKDEENGLLHERNAEAERSYRQTKTALVAGSSLALLIAVISGGIIPRAYAARGRAEAAFLSSEERMRILVEGVHDYAIVMLDSQGAVVSWNAGAERCLASPRLVMTSPSARKRRQSTVACWRQRRMQWWWSTKPVRSYC
jgi:CHASE3 domain sensor protein